MPEFLQFDFMQRAFVSGISIGLICPIIGVFIIMRRQSLVGDGLGHIAFAGVATGWLLGVYPVMCATLFTVAAALGIEELRARRPAFADMMLAIFFYAGMALAVLFSSMSKASNVNLMSYLFGSIVTVSLLDVEVIVGLAAIVLLVMRYIFKELLFATFDEEAAIVSGVPVKKINLIIVLLTALTVSISMRVVGVLLVAALMIVPVAASLQLSGSFKGTVINAVLISEVSVVGGLIASYYLSLASGGTIVLGAVVLFVLAFFFRQNVLDKYQASGDMQSQRNF